MRQLCSAVSVLVLAATAITTATAQTDAKKSAVCQRTSSKAAPYKKVLASGAALARVLANPAAIFPMPKGGCPRTVMTATAGGTPFDIALVGESETPAGDPVATGTATVRLRAGQAQACYQISATNLPPSVGAHIHTGAAGTSGDVVIPFTTPDSSGKSSGCAKTTRPLVKSILAAPGSFYVNVHTAEFPGGAIRGQLEGSSQTAFGWIAARDLVGSTEPNAKGTAVVRIRKDAGLVCYRLTAQNVTLPTIAAHIHRGAAGVNGPVLVPFTPPGASGTSDGCATATAALIDEIIANPAGFYVNIHTTEHPGGAIRQQLG